MVPGGHGDEEWTNFLTVHLFILFLSSGALTLISSITDRANDSMEQGVSPDTNPPLGEGSRMFYSPLGLLCPP